MDMEIKNNPVGRLRDLMEEYRRTAQDDQKLGKVWANVLRCEEGNTKLIFKGISSVFELSEEARRSTELYLPASPAFFFEPFDKVDQLLSLLTMHTPWRNVSHLLDNATMTALSFVEHSLDSHYAKPEIGTNDKIAALLAKLDGLIESCVGSGINDELAWVLVRQLQALRSALLEYRIFGAKGLEVALDQTAGSILRHQAAVKDELASGNKFVEQFFDALGKANDLVAGYQVAAPMLAPVTLMLLDILK